LALQNINSNHLSQSKKLKLNQNEKQIRFHSSAKHNKKRSEQEMSKAQSWKYPTCAIFQIIQIVYDTTNNSDLLCTLLNIIDSNRHRLLNNYRYPNSVLRFATC
jgi:hypothetical protein